VKARSWAALLSGQVSTAQARLMAGAFWQRGQDALCEPYVDGYLAAVPGFWRDLTPVLAQYLTQFLFPTTLVRADVVERVQALLAQDLPAGARRVLLEQLDDLERALRAQGTG
jgi:hypothetical protein